MEPPFFVGDLASAPHFTSHAERAGFSMFFGLPGGQQGRDQNTSNRSIGRHTAAVPALGDMVRHPGAASPPRTAAVGASEGHGTFCAAGTCAVGRHDGEGDLL